MHDVSTAQALPQKKKEKKDGEGKREKNEGEKKKQTKKEEENEKNEKKNKENKNIIKTLFNNTYIIKDIVAKQHNCGSPKWEVTRLNPRVYMDIYHFVDPPPRRDQKPPAT